MSTRISAMWTPPVLFAHRGAKAHARDNTIDAFELALRLGSTGMETDAWVTRDGEVVLDHDGWHRWFPRRWIRDVDRVDLRNHIPTLAQYYEAVGTELLTRWLLPFEVTAMLLLIGIVGATVVAKRRA